MYTQAQLDYLLDRAESNRIRSERLEIRKKEILLELHTINDEQERLDMEGLELLHEIEQIIKYQEVYNHGS